MNLLELRTKLIDLSGRYDLVVDATAGDYTDNGANFFLTQAQRYLDRKLNIVNSTARFIKQLTTGNFAVLFQNCRVIESVWVANGESRLELKKVNYNKLRGTDYPSQENAYVGLFTSMDKGRPLYYSPAHLRLSPDSGEAIAGLAGGYLGYLDVMFGSDYTVNGVIILPPADGSYMVEVFGKFYSNALINDDDESGWSVNYPEVLLMAAMLQIEIFNRNSEGVKDWRLSLEDALVDIDKDVVEQESMTVTQMEG